MDWRPMIDPGDERVLNLLTDLDIRKIQQLEENMSRTTLKREKLSCEKEILNIYLKAIERNKGKQMTLGDWLNQEELDKVNELKERIVDSDKPYHYEAMAYEVYLESISRQTNFDQEKDVRACIEIMKNTESNEEAEKLAIEILTLLRLAR
ncbi:hypothetical protein [Ornithinibacillus sp. 179-J 7C1 HS]|uniref:hypothetical protein n=1 Tax=Ornithinibacillus sp. 179-J 7C1 HS TaxID=3142384 RepID=UPI00399FEB49